MTATDIAPETPKIQTRYSGRAEQIYMDICYTLSERIDQVDWAAYTVRDWSVLARMADAEGVAPLMYWNLKDHRTADDQYDVPGLEVPPEIFHQLKTSYYNTLAQNTLMYQELERILQAFDEAGIPVIILKGAALAATIYENIGLRPMGDLDLLIRHDEFSFALSILEVIGFHKKKYQGRSLWVDPIIDHHVVISEQDQDRIEVEIHWSLIGGESDYYAPTLNWFWDNAKHFTGLRSPDGKDELIKQLTPTAYVAYLSAHLMLQHGGIESRLIWYYDIYLLICSQANFVDWDILLQRVDEYRWSYALCTTLLQAHERFLVSYPKWVNESFQKVKDQQSERLIQSKSDYSQPRTIRYWNKLLSMDWMGRMRFLLSMIIPTPDFMIRRYKIRNPWMLPFYYLYRWSDSLIDIILTMGKVLLFEKK